ncbi:hypothetical protein JRQ81_011635 [Phrynocephalus forsythii]|uniref:UPAR/Ly6 domain-containing protein n=1 Tax=Phrynocephalus forsythii TaxID=171643 RepID=A0A9Q1AQ87_9SAUR|nr:hypothetical protein JRQ81_011635 [Phrynocephalus forsythii]
MSLNCKDVVKGSCWSAYLFLQTMKLLILSFFAVLVATANSTLKCACTAESATCVDGSCFAKDRGTCVSVAYETEAKKVVQYKACQNRSDTFDVCKEKYMFINTADNEFYLRSHTECCYRDNCNHKSIAVPAESPISHWGCPSCFKIGSLHCETKMLNCTQEQNLCINITGTTTTDSKEKDFALQGCATSTAAVLKKGAKLDNGSSTFYIDTIDVRHAGTSRLLGSISFVLLIPTLFVLLLGKFQY